MLTKKILAAVATLALLPLNAVLLGAVTPAQASSAPTTTTGTTVAAPSSSVAAPSAVMPAAATPTEEFCSGTSYVKKTLANGTTWEMCWRIENAKGLVLSKVAVQGPNDPAPRLVLDSIAPTSMHVPYDVGTTMFDDIIMFGFGQNASRMTEAECPGGEIRNYTLTSEFWFGGWSEVDRPTLCLREVGTGLAYRSSWWSGGVNLTAQGTALQVSIESAIGNYEYETNYKFNDNGKIDVAVGATGEIASTVWADRIAGLTAQNYGWPVGQGNKDFASSHYHSAVWRVDFGIDGKNDQKVEQTDTVWTKKRGAQSALMRTDTKQITQESLFNNAKRRSWRVYSPSSLNGDQHPRGYEVLFGKEDAYEATPSYRNALSFTSNNVCEQYADGNINHACSGQGIVDYANGQSLVDPVAWVNVGFHHIVRDEDQSPMPVHWQGFSLVPRDFWAMSPITPQARNGFNGRLSDGGPTTNTAPASTSVLTMRTTGHTPATTPKATLRVTSAASRVVGVVTIMDGPNELMETVMRLNDDGRIDFDLPKLALGTHSLTAYFSGSNAVADSVSAPVVVEVSRYASTTTATLASASVTTAQQAVLRVRVAAEAEPDGTLVVTNGTGIVATAKLAKGAGGQATITLPRLAKGTYSLRVGYMGTGDVGDSTSNAVTLTVR